MLKGYGGYDEHFEIQALEARKGGKEGAYLYLLTGCAPEFIPETNKYTNVSSCDIQTTPHGAVISAAVRVFVVYAWRRRAHHMR